MAEKSTGVDMEQNYVSVTLCIAQSDQQETERKPIQAN